VSQKSTFSQNDIFVLFTCLVHQKHMMNDTYTLECPHPLAIPLNHLLMTSVLCLLCRNAYLVSPFSIALYNSFIVTVKEFNSAKMLTNNGQDQGLAGY